VGIVCHITIGNHVTIGAQAGVINSIPDNKVVLGAPAVDANMARRAYSMIQYLPDMRQSIRELQNKMKQITSSVESNSEEPAEEETDTDM